MLAYPSTRLVPYCYSLELGISCNRKSRANSTLTDTAGPNADDEVMVTSATGVVPETTTTAGDVSGDIGAPATTMSPLVARELFLYPPSPLYSTCCDPTGILTMSSKRLLIRKAQRRQRRTSSHTRRIRRDDHAP